MRLLRRLFRRNVEENTLTPFVEALVHRSFEVDWDKPIAFLFIDGLHDYGNVSRDFHHFVPWVMAGGYIAFHDYADYYPGVKMLVAGGSTASVVFSAALRTGNGTSAASRRSYAAIVPSAA